MKRYFITALMVLSLGLGFGGFASAQEEGFPFPPEAPAADPAPANPAQLQLESGKVMVVVGSTRHFGYRIGEPLPITIVISADPGVHVNIDGITRSVLSSEGSDFELVEKPLVGKETRGNKTVYKIQLKLRSWVIKPTLQFTADFLYATDLLPDGKSPNWKTASTPVFVITTSNTASDTAKELLEGDTDKKMAPTPVLASPMRIAGYVLVSVVPLLMLYRLWRRTRPIRALTPAEKAWRRFDRILSDSAAAGKLSYLHLEQIAETLREYLGVGSVALDEVAKPLDAFFDGEENKLELLTTAVSALSKLDNALYSKVELKDQEKAELLDEIGRLVPRA